MSMGSMWKRTMPCRNGKGRVCRMKLEEIDGTRWGGRSVLLYGATLFLGQGALWACPSRHTSDIARDNINAHHHHMPPKSSSGAAYRPAVVCASPSQERISERGGLGKERAASRPASTLLIFKRSENLSGSRSCPCTPPSLGEAVPVWRGTR
jgi:hypothetical protein